MVGGGGGDGRVRYTRRSFGGGGGGGGGGVVVVGWGVLGGLAGFLGSGLVARFLGSDTYFLDVVPAMVVV